MKPIEPRDGEIIQPGETVRFFLFEHALQNSRRLVEVPAGLSVSEALDMALDEAENKQLQRHSFVIYLQDGTPVPEHMWERVRLKASTALVARPVAEGPLLMLIPAFGTFITGLGIFGQLLMAGITMGLKFLLNKLFAPKPPKPTPSDASPVYSISGSRNQVSPWNAIPLILGRHRFTPPLAASPYTEVVGDEQYLRQLFCNGYGPLAIEAATAKIGETLLSTYKEATVQHREGYTTSEDVTSLYPKSVIEEALSVELKWVDPWFTKTTATDTLQIGLDFMWPNGLCGITEEGQRVERQCQINIQYRRVGTTPYVQIPIVDVTKATMKTVRYTRTFTFPSVGQYEVRVLKITPEAEQATLDHFHWQVMETVMYTAIRSFRTGEPVAFDDAPLSFTALRIKASGRLNQMVDTYNVIATSRVKAFNGSTWVANTPSRNPADLYRWVLQCGANRRPFPDSKIDLPALQSWWAYCNAEGWKFDLVVLNQTSVFDLVSQICAAGRAMPVFKDGKWSVVWDEQNVPVAQLFTPRNSWNFEEQRDLEPIPHAYRIRFPNEDKGWIEDERIVYNDGYSKTNATLLEGFDVPGITHTNRAWRHGRFHLAQRILRPGVFTLSTSWDALPLIRGDRVRVNYDTFKYGLYSGRVVSVDATLQTVTIDTNVTLAGATTYVFNFRLSNGTFLLRSIDPGYVGEFTTIGLVGTGLPLPVANDLFSLGYSGKDSRVLRVVGIEPEDDLVHRLTLVDDAPEIANADTGQIPDYSTGISEPIDPFLMPPKNLKLTDGVYSDGGKQYWANILASWEGPPYGRVRNYQIQYREDNDQEDVWTSVPMVGPDANTIDIRRLESGVYTVRIRCLFDNNKYSNWVVSAAKATTEFTLPPPDVQNFRISTMGDISILRWDDVPGVGITYDLRYCSAETAAPAWNSAIPLTTSVVTSASIGTRVGTFFIKAKKPWGVASANAKSIYTEVGSLTAINFIAQIDEAPGFTGVKANTELEGNELRLTNDATGLVFAGSGTYNFINRIDLGENIYSRLTLIIDAYGFNPVNAMSTWITLASVDPLDTLSDAEWGISTEFRVTAVSPTLNQWGPWQQFSLSDVLAWAIEFRTTLRGKTVMDLATDTIYAVATPSIRKLSVKIDMVDRIEKGDDILAPAAGLTVTYPNGAFRVDPAVVVTPQDMVQGDYYKITAKTKTSFKVNFYSLSNAGKALTFDWMAKGWGKVKT